MAAWLTAESPELADLWPGHIDVHPDSLAVLLDAAAEQCEEFLDGRYSEHLLHLPARWKLAQALQAKALAGSGLTGRDDEIGGFGDTVTVFPMDWTVKNLLRPKQGGITVA